MELEDAELSLRKQRAAVISSMRRMAGIERMHKKGSLTNAQYKSEQVNMRYQTAVEAELVASRDLISYRRAVLKGEVVNDKAKAVELVRNLLDKREVAARINFDYLTDAFNHKDSLFQKKLIRRAERDEAEQTYIQAEARLFLVRLRRARLNYETAAAKSKDNRTVISLRIEYLQSMVRYDELLAADALSQLNVARTRLRVGLIAQEEVNAFERSADAANVTLETDRKELAGLQPPAKPEPSKEVKK